MANWTEPKVDWVTNPKNPRAEDFNRIEGNIQFLKEDIENKKDIIIGALEDVGLSVDEGSTFAEIADAIINANQGKKIITPGTSNITIPKGFHNGEGYVVGDSDLKASNIKKGVNIFGVAGTCNPAPNVGTMLFSGACADWNVNFEKGWSRDRDGNDPGVTIQFNYGDEIQIGGKPGGSGVSSSSPCDIAVVTTSKIDLTNVKYIMALVHNNYVASGAYIGIAASTVKYGSKDTYNAFGSKQVYDSYERFSDREVIVADVRNLVGEYYIRVHYYATSSSSGHVIYVNIYDILLLM